MLLHQFLEESARCRPQATALIDARRTATYAEMDILANRFANLYRQSGVSRHDRVVIAMENSVDFAGAYFGALKAGAAAVPLPAGPRSDRLGTAIADCDPAVAVIDWPTAQDTGRSHPLCDVPKVFVSSPARPVAVSSPFRSLEHGLRQAGEEPPAVRPIDIDLAAIIYTSGSTGEPRGVMLTHRNIVANTRSIVSYLGLTAADRVMCVLPFYYVYGLSLLHTHVAVGGSVVVDNRFAFPNVVLEAMQRLAVTGFAGVPSTFSLLLHRSDLDQTDFPALRYVTQAGGGMPVARIHEWLERGPDVPFYVMYGATEASARLTYLEPSRLRDKMGSIGRPIPNVEIVVVADGGRLAAPNEVGELYARGTNIALGYWNNPDETRERFTPLGYCTGDLGYVDSDGFLFLVGRKHDMLKVGAHRVGAKEIEDLLNRYPGVSEAAVVAAPDDLLGEVPVAFLSFRRGTEGSVEGLQGFCRTNLAPHKVPVRFEFKAELPKISGIGKIDKRALRDEAARPRAPHTR